MKKLIVACMILMLTFTGCSSEEIKYKLENSKYRGNVELNYNYDMLTRIVDVPDDWQTAKCQCFYYDINTYTIYVGTSTLDTYGTFVYKLESAEYRCYTYDTETGEFIGNR